MKHTLILVFGQRKTNLKRMQAEIVQGEMNRCGAIGHPFLFGVDFELKNGFFVENPLENCHIPFVVGKVSNVKHATENCSTPELEILETNMEAYRQKFNIVHAGLLYGNSFLLNLTEKTHIKTNLTLEQIFYQSRSRYKLLLPNQFVCFSPESFVQINNGQIFSYPMKGTIDANLVDAETILLNDYKEKCEHNTIVDLIRNDLSMLAENVQVKRFRYVEEIQTTQGNILQTSSEITGQLPLEWQEKLGDLIFKLLPAGSISGAPKKATIELIQVAEQIKRGYYTGVFGYFDGKNLDSAVMIRYIEKKNDKLFFRSGGGITINSICADEYNEALKKIYLPFI